MDRISRVQMFIQMAEVAARRSTCFRRNVGCIIVKDNNILSIGYNGAPSGEEHCTGNGCASERWGCTRAVHAEINAMERMPFAFPDGISMYVTESPCPNCARMIATKIDEVYFLHQYRLVEGCEILVNAGVKLYRVTPAGHVIDWKTGELL